MSEALLACLAVVEVLADAALVTDSLDGCDPASITLHIFVYNFVLLILVELVILVLQSTSKVFALQKVVKYFCRLFLELAVDEILKGLRGMALFPSFLVLFFLTPLCGVASSSSTSSDQAISSFFSSRLG